MRILGHRQSAVSSQQYQHPRGGAGTLTTLAAEGHNVMWKTITDAKRQPAKAKGRMLQRNETHAVAQRREVPGSKVQQREN